LSDPTITTIATLGSHSALQILRGAKDEGFRTMVICTPDRTRFYERFKFIDVIETIPSYGDFASAEHLLKDQQAILIPHGSFVAYLGKERNKALTTPYFGNKAVLDWEEDRQKQRQWMEAAKINQPRHFDSVEDVDYPVIVKSFGAAGGKGYFYAKDRADYEAKIKTLGDNNFIIQEYVIGVTLYLHYFQSPLTGEIEITSIDRRYETNVDSLGRIPLVNQEELIIEPSFVVVGNSPLAIRESMLAESFYMGERVVAASKRLMGEPGLFGPFCLETVITPDQQIYVIEISGRIVAGTNLYIHGSPYSWLNYDEPMSTGRRVAREIKHAQEAGKLSAILG
jgi:5-formaminoimidazole-4-carboxamide-1-(beta)-D-ribofuranosyl 5'-monophosphate synthetase